MFEHRQSLDSSKEWNVKADQSHKPSYSVPSSRTNSFSCINTANTSSNSWPVEEIFLIHEDSPAIQAKAYVPTARSKFRDAIMNHAQELERSKQTPKTPAAGNIQNRKRKTPEDIVRASSVSDEPLTKRLKTGEPIGARNHSSDAHTLRKIPASTTGLSAETMCKLDAFRFSAPSDPSKDFRRPSSEVKETGSCNAPVGRGNVPFATKPRYSWKDHSSRLIQTGKKEMVKQSDKSSTKVHQIVHVDPHEEVSSSARDSAHTHHTEEVHHDDRDTVRPQSRYKIKDHSSRLIQAGIDAAQEEIQVSESLSELRGESVNEDEAGLASAPFTQYKIRDHASTLIEAGREELAIQAKQHTSVVCEVHDSLQSTHINSTKADDALVDLDDLDDSFFDDPSLDESVFEEATPTNTTAWTETDEMDDSVFDHIITEEEADWQEAPPSAQIEIKCFDGDTVSSPIKSGLMLPPKLPPQDSPSNHVVHAGSNGKSAPPDAPISPFLRPSLAVLVTSPSTIPNLHPAGRVVTCFRLAELLRELSGVSPPAAIELFATVTASVRNRDSTSQSFTFADLFFPQRPPYIHGLYSRCAESELFDDDSRNFLKAGQGGRGVLARAVVRPMSRSGKQRRWNRTPGFHASEEPSVGMEVEVLSVYVCPWDDVEYTKGIIMPEKDAQTKKERDKEVFYKPEKKGKFSALMPLNQQQKAALKDISSNLPSSPARLAGNKN